MSREYDEGGATTEEGDNTNANSSPATCAQLLWKDKKTIFLLIAGRAIEFTASAILSAGLSNESNAEVASLIELIQSFFTVGVGSFIFGSLIDLSIARGQLQLHLKNPQEHRKPNITIRIAAATFTSLLSSLATAPLIRFADPILSPIITNSTLRGEAADKAWILYKRGVPLTFHLNWMVDSILNAFNYDKTFLASKGLRFLLIILLKNIFITSADDNERFAEFSWASLLSFALPTILSLIVLFCTGSNKATNEDEDEDEDDSNVTEIFVSDHVSLGELTATGSFGEFTSAFSRQLRSGASKAASLVPALAVEFSYAPLALLISQEALASMRGFISTHLVVLLCGIASATQMSRISGLALGGIHPNTSDNELNKITTRLHLSQHSYTALNLSIGLLAILTSLVYTPFIAGEFAPGNPFLSDRVPHIILQLGSAFWIMNDGEEGLLDGIRRIGVKSMTSPTALLLCIPAGYGLIRAGGKVNGLFGGTAIIMLGYSVFLIIYTHHTIPHALTEYRENLRQRPRAIANRTDGNSLFPRFVYDADSGKKVAIQYISAKNQIEYAEELEADGSVCRLVSSV